MQRISGIDTILTKKIMSKDLTKKKKKNQVLLHFTNRILSLFLANPMT